MHPDSDRRLPGGDVSSEDLADADLRRAPRLVLVADHPERNHRARVVARLGAQLDPAVLRRVEANVRLRLAHDRLRIEPVLANRAADRAGELTRLQRRHAKPAVELGTPRLLVGLDEEP